MYFFVGFRFPLKRILEKVAQEGKREDSRNGLKTMFLK